MIHFEVFDLGIVGYLQAWEFQKKTHQKVKEGDYPSGLIVCRHYPVITMGRQAKNENILLSPQELNEKGIQVFQVERGGDVTYHGPGQLTIYPIFNLHYLKKDIHWFLRQLEEVVIAMFGELGVKAQRIAG